ncbi:MAG: hypothetical protein LBS21_05020 [Clostridiales bacterium]|nr:hypothetical protein [Clostridiales bacterium]
MKIFKNGFLKAIVGMLFFLLMLFIISNLPAFIKPDKILKSAIFYSGLGKQNYILCQPCGVTGFEWRLIGGTGANNAFDYCIVKGEDPLGELKPKYEFMTAGNTFVFYVEEKRTSFSEAINEDASEYVVSEWDILYPVRHDDFFMFDLFGSKKYITETDILEKR